MNFFICSERQFPKEGRLSCWESQGLLYIVPFIRGGYSACLGMSALFQSYSVGYVDRSVDMYIKDSDGHLKTDSSLLFQQDPGTWLVGLPYRILLWCVSCATVSSVGPHDNIGCFKISSCGPKIWKLLISSILDAKLSLI